MHTCSGIPHWAAFDNEIITKCSITIMTKDELGDLSGGGLCTENGAWWWNQRIKKATKAEKDAFM